MLVRGPAGADRMVTRLKKYETFTPQSARPPVDDFRSISMRRHPRGPAARLKGPRPNVTLRGLASISERTRVRRRLPLKRHQSRHHLANKTLIYCETGRSVERMVARHCTKICTRLTALRDDTCSLCRWRRPAGSTPPDQDLAGLQEGYVMNASPILDNEPARLQEIAALGLAGFNSKDPNLADIIRIACAVADTPIAMINILNRARYHPPMAKPDRLATMAMAMIIVASIDAERSDRGALPAHSNAGGRPWLQRHRPADSSAGVNRCGRRGCGRSDCRRIARGGDVCG